MNAVAACVSMVAFACTLSACSSDPAPDPVAASKAASWERDSRAKHEDSFQKVVAVMKALKVSQREPESMVWDEITASEDASVICISYRSRNGFGGMAKAVLVVARKKASDQPTAWNKHCAGKQLNQYRHAVQAL